MAATPATVRTQRRGKLSTVDHRILNRGEVLRNAAAPVADADPSGSRLHVQALVSIKGDFESRRRPRRSGVRVIRERISK